MSEELNMAVPEHQTAAVAVVGDVREIIEALLFASDEPVSLQTLRVVFDDMNSNVPEAEKINPTNEDIREAVVSLNAGYEESRRAYRIQQLAGGYVFATEKKFSVWVGKLFKEKARRKLSQTAVETLAIIAYKQPITKSEVEFIRGVNADYIMKTLLEKNLATIVGRAHSPGRPLLYGTTADFLRHFGLNEISDLPKPREIEELLGETEREVEKRMIADQQEIEFKEKLVEKLDPNSRAPHIPRKKSKLQEPPKEGEGKTVVEKTTPIQLPKIPHENTIEEIPQEDAKPEEIGANPPVVEPVDAIPDSVQEESALYEEEKPQEEPSIPPIENSESPTSVEEISDISPVPTLAETVSAVEPGVDAEIIHADTGVQQPSESLSQEGHDAKKGWSTWKTKIQTFFRKLFG